MSPHHPLLKALYVHVDVPGPENFCYPVVVWTMHTFQANGSKFSQLCQLVSWQQVQACVAQQHKLHQLYLELQSSAVSAKVQQVVVECLWVSSFAISCSMISCLHSSAQSQPSCMSSLCRVTTRGWEELAMEKSSSTKLNPMIATQLRWLTWRDTGKDKQLHGMRWRKPLRETLFKVKLSTVKYKTSFDCDFVWQPCHDTSPSCSYGPV